MNIFSIKSFFFNFWGALYSVEKVSNPHSRWPRFLFLPQNHPNHRPPHCPTQLRRWRPSSTHCYTEPCALFDAGSRARLSPARRRYVDALFSHCWYALTPRSSPLPLSRCSSVSFLCCGIKKRCTLYEAWHPFPRIRNDSDVRLIFFPRGKIKIKTFNCVWEFFEK